ncbi:MAG: hypothetical protein AB4041_08785 [Microcystaceae cyanobacterium]
MTIVKGIKKGNTIELLEDIKIPDGQEVIIDLQTVDTLSLNQTLLNKWQHLCETGQELNPDDPLTASEIRQIRQLLHTLNQSCPVGLAEGEFTVPDNFNDPLPDDILASFYPQ